VHFWSLSGAKNTTYEYNDIYLFKIFQGLHLHKAVSYLKAVCEGTRCIPFKRFCGGVGRTGQAKAFNSTTSQGRWPKKSCQHLLGLLKNAESNAEVKGLDVDALVIDHIQVRFFVSWKLGHQLFCCDLGHQILDYFFNDKITSRLTRLRNNDDEHTERTVVLTRTWHPLAMLKLFWRKKTSLFHVQLKSAPKRFHRRSWRSKRWWRHNRADLNKYNICLPQDSARECFSRLFLTT